MMILNNFQDRSSTIIFVPEYIPQFLEYILFQKFQNFFFFLSIVTRSWWNECAQASGLSRFPTWFPCRACFIEEAAISRPRTWYGKRVEMHRRVSREVPSAWFPSPRLYGCVCWCFMVQVSITSHLPSVLYPLHNRRVEFWQRPRGFQVFNCFCFNGQLANLPRILKWFDIKVSF